MFQFQSRYCLNWKEHTEKLEGLGLIMQKVIHTSDEGVGFVSSFVMSCSASLNVSSFEDCCVSLVIWLSLSYSLALTGLIFVSLLGTFSSETAVATSAKVGILCFGISS